MYVNETYLPPGEAELAGLIAQAASQKLPLEISGNGTKRVIGRPMQVATRLATSEMRGITLYEPTELVISALSGTPLADIEALLETNGQELPFEPHHLERLSPVEARGPVTIGGAIAANCSGPRRILRGSARDHLIGIRAVNGLGEIIKSGGRVMKNVTGYDLPKLLCGSFGTLAVMTDITVKVLPRPEKARTVLALGLDDAQARDAMAAALNSPHEVSGAAHLPHAVAQRSGVGYVRGAGHAVTAIRVEGFGPSVEARCKSLRDLLAPFGPTEELHSQNTAALWGEIRDVAALLPDGALDLWRLSLPPASGAGVMASLAFGDGFDTAHHFYDWGGGLLWLAVPRERQAETAAAIRAAVAPTHGHATLIRGSMEAREAALAALSLATAALERQLKAAFDPHGILNPGRIDGAA